MVVLDECGIVDKPMHIESPWNVTDDNCKSPIWSIIDGDGSVPSLSAANDLLDAAARFEIRNIGHLEILFDNRLLLLISCIMGLNVLPEERKEWK